MSADEIVDRVIAYYLDNNEAPYLVSVTLHPDRVRIAHHGLGLRSPKAHEAMATLLAGGEPPRRRFWLGPRERNIPFAEIRSIEYVPKKGSVAGHFKWKLTTNQIWDVLVKVRVDVLCFSDHEENYRRLIEAIRARIAGGTAPSAPEPSTPTPADAETATTGD